MYTTYKDHLFFSYIHLIMVGEELVLYLVCINILVEEKDSCVLLCSVQESGFNLYDMALFYFK